MFMKTVLNIMPWGYLTSILYLVECLVFLYMSMNTFRFHVIFQILFCLCRIYWMLYWVSWRSVLWKKITSLHKYMIFIDTWIVDRIAVMKIWNLCFFHFLLIYIWKEVFLFFWSIKYWKWTFEHILDSLWNLFIIFSWINKHFIGLRI